MAYKTFTGESIKEARDAADSSSVMISRKWITRSRCIAPDSSVCSVARSFTRSRSAMMKVLRPGGVV